MSKYNLDSRTMLHVSEMWVHRIHSRRCPKNRLTLSECLRQPHKTVRHHINTNSHSIHKQSGGPSKIPNSRTCGCNECTCLCVLAISRYVNMCEDTTCTSMRKPHKMDETPHNPSYPTYSSRPAQKRECGGGVCTGPPIGL